MYLLFDTETTGLLHEDPHIVQLAALLANAQYETIGEVNLLIKPDGWVVPEELVKVHGISTERAARYGVPIAAALSVFDGMERQAQVLVAHNINFDHAIINLEYRRLGWMRWRGKRRFCTMLESEGLVAIPSPFRYGYKWPTLIEAHEKFFGEGFANAHNARADLQACLRVFKHLQETINRSPFQTEDRDALLRWFIHRL